MKKIILMAGVPGSGKSTYLKNKVDNLSRVGLTSRIISRDEIRKFIVGENISNSKYFSKEDEVFNEFVKQINEALASDIDYVCIDATHITRKSRKKILSKLCIPSGVKLEVVSINPDLHTCLNRNKQRIGFSRVPSDAIKRMFFQYQKPQSSEFSKEVFDSIEIVTVE